MVSGSNNKTKNKGKMVLAKDPKQLAIAIVVLLLLGLNSIYMIVKYVQEQNPAPTQASASALEKEKLLMGKNPDGSPISSTAQPQAGSAGAPTTGPNGQPVPNAEAPNAGGTAQTLQDPTNPQNMQTPQTVTPPPAAGINPIVPILIILLLVLLAYFASQYMKKNGSGNNSFKKSGSKLGSKDKGKMALAKDPKQFAIAMVVIAIFVGNSIYMLVKYIQEQNPQPMTAQNSQPLTPEQKLAQEQKMNLESLGTNPNAAAPSPNPNVAQDANDIYSQTVNLRGGSQQAMPNDARSVGNSAESDVEIMPRRMVRDKSGKMVMITVSSSGRSNPFLPAAENYVPSAKSSMSFLPPPPETLQENSDAGKVMTTVISGILYDKYSPSAIINIEGVDYLVKRGDVVNKYKVLLIGKTQVIVQLGKNIYKAGVGELLSPTDMNFNTIANLNKKFGGNDVSIHVKKKGY